MEDNKFLNFLVEIAQRLKAKSPKFFQVLQWISGIATAITGLPEFLTFIGINLPQGWMITANKTVAIAAGTAWLISKLTVSDASKYSNKLKFTKPDEPKQ